MSDLILHHYPASPFAEKIRLVMGFKKLAWKSVIVPNMMPKPDVLALTGGYRKTPFLQVGADIYCDTALICDVLEHLHPGPSLYPAKHKGLARILSQWADDKVFQAAMGYNFSPKGAAQLFSSFPGTTPENIATVSKAFIEDRAKMRLGQPRMPPADAAATYKSYSRRLANMLDSQDFLLGNEPSVADFSAYHPLWFTRTQVSVMAGVLDATPGVLAWMDRMASLGHGMHQDCSSSEAIEACAQSGWTDSVFGNEQFQDEHGIELGSQVTIAADSFGPEPTEGELISATRMHYTLRRTDDRAGTVQVHFPRIGFILKKVAA